MRSKEIEGYGEHHGGFKITLDFALVLFQVVLVFDASVGFEAEARARAADVPKKFERDFCSGAGVDVFESFRADAAADEEIGLELEAIGLDELERQLELAVELEFPADAGVDVERQRFRQEDRPGDRLRKRKLEGVITLAGLGQRIEDELAFQLEALLLALRDCGRMTSGSVGAAWPNSVPPPTPTPARERLLGTAASRGVIFASTTPRIWR